MKSTMREKRKKKYVFYLILSGVITNFGQKGLLSLGSNMFTGLVFFKLSEIHFRAVSNID